MRMTYHVLDVVASRVVSRDDTIVVIVGDFELRLSEREKSDKRSAGDPRGSNFRLLVTRCNEDKLGIFCYASNPRTNFFRRASE